MMVIHTHYDPQSNNVAKLAFALLISASAEDKRQLSHRFHEAKVAPQLQESILGRSWLSASRREMEPRF